MYLMMSIKRNKSKLSLLLSICLLMCILQPIVYAVTLSSSEQSKIDSYKEQQEELNDKISSTKEKMESIKDDISKQEEYVTELNEQIDNYQSKINSLDEQIAELESEEAVYQEKIDELDTEIDGIEDDINHNELQQIDLQQEIEDANVELQERLRSVYVNGSATTVEMLLNADSFSTYLTMIELSSNMAKHDNELVETLTESIKQIDELTASHKEMITQLESKKDEQQAQIDALEVKKSEKVEAKNTLSTSQSEVRALQVEATNLLNSLDEQSAAYKSMVAKYESDIDAFDKKIDSIIAEATAKANAAKTSSSSGSSSTTSNFTPKSGFIWPLQQSDAYISSGYGYRGDPGTGTYKLHGGVDTCCYSGTSGKAVSASADGTVIIATWHSSYGYYVGIDHGNGYVTIYAHNSSLAVSAGQTVKQGQTIAYAGETGYAFGAHCHFEIRVNGTKVNPTSYTSPGR